MTFAPVISATAVPMVSLPVRLASPIFANATPALLASPETSIDSLFPSFLGASAIRSAAIDMSWHESAADFHFGDATDAQETGDSPDVLTLDSQRRASSQLLTGHCIVVIRPGFI
jgi:hypothetical protein